MRLFQYKEEIGFPEEMLEYIDYIQDFSTDETPDYVYLKSIFEKGLNKFSTENKPVLFDWVVMNVPL